MTLQQLKDLCAVVRHGSFRAAARAQCISQSGLTKSVARLEHEYCVLLIERTPRGVQLSRAGEEFLAHAQGILRCVEQAECCLRQSALHPLELTAREWTLS